MAGTIFALIVAIISIVAAVSKQKQEKNTKKQAPNTAYPKGGYSKNPYTERNTSYQRSATEKNTMNQKATVRAKESKTEQTSNRKMSAAEFKKMAGVDIDDGAILSAAKMHSLATELGNEFDSREDLMEPVFNLMVTGPNTSIPNERDFVSEGMDLINAYTLES